MVKQKPKSQIGPLRRVRGMTQLYLANAVGVTVAALQYWENGKTDKASEHILFVLLCAALNCEPEDLIESFSKEPCLEAARDPNTLNSLYSNHFFHKSRLPNLRRLRGLTQANLAEAIGVDEKTVQNWENGKTGLKALIHFVKLCKLLVCEAQDLIDYIPQSRVDELCRVMGCTDEEISKYIVRTKIYDDTPQISSHIRNRSLEQIRSTIRRKDSRVRTSEDKLL